MKKLFLTTAVAILCVLWSVAAMAQTGLNQTDLMKKWLGSGTWQAKYNADTTEVWECRSYGQEGIIVEVSYLIHGKKTPYYHNSISYDPGESNFKGFVLESNGRYVTWIGAWSDEKTFSIDLVSNFDPASAGERMKHTSVSPGIWTWSEMDMNGVVRRTFTFTRQE